MVKRYNSDGMEETNELYLNIAARIFPGWTLVAEDEERIIVEDR